MALCLASGRIGSYRDRGKGNYELSPTRDALILNVERKLFFLLALCVARWAVSPAPSRRSNHDADAQNRRGARGKLGLQDSE